MLTEKERRILSYHEAGHALMSFLMGEVAPVQKVTIVARGQALGYTLNLPSEDRYMETKEELVDVMKICLAGRAAEQVVFGRVTNGAASDLEKATQIARSMVFEWGMSDSVSSRTLRADNYALSEETKRLRDQEQALLTDGAYTEAIRLIEKHRASLDRLSNALLEKETLLREELVAMLGDLDHRVQGLRARRHAAGHLAARVAPGRIAPVEAKGIHHLGVAVEDLDEAVTTYERLFGARVEHRDTVPDQGVEAASMRVGESRVELLASLGDDTPVGKFLAKRGPGMHHVAYAVADLPASLAELEREGAELIDRPAAPRPVRARGRLRPPRRGPRRPCGAGERCRLRTRSGSRSPTRAASRSRR